MLLTAVLVALSYLSYSVPVCSSIMCTRYIIRTYPHLCITDIIFRAPDTGVVGDIYTRAVYRVL